LRQLASNVSIIATLQKSVGGGCAVWKKMARALKKIIGKPLNSNDFFCEDFSHNFDIRFFFDVFFLLFLIKQPHFSDLQIKR
jgi:hypothetical protein